MVVCGGVGVVVEVWFVFESRRSFNGTLYELVRAEYSSIPLAKKKNLPSVACDRPLFIGGFLPSKLSAKFQNFGGASFTS
jgi:hypothetical protein